MLFLDQIVLIPILGIFQSKLIEKPYLINVEFGYFLLNKAEDTVNTNPQNLEKRYFNGDAN